MHKPMPTSPLYSRAIDFLERHQGEHLAPDEHRLVARCAYELLDNGAPSYPEARGIALQAMGELSARGRRSYIDLDHSTSYALFVANGDGKTNCYTLAQVLRALEHATAAGTI